MSRDDNQTYTAREIVLEFFPATPAELVPKSLDATNSYRIVGGQDGRLVIFDANGHEAHSLAPVLSSGNPNNKLCCDLCHRTGGRDFLQFLRSEVPGSGGRRFRYLSACKDIVGCEGRRTDDGPVLALLGRAETG